MLTQVKEKIDLLNASKNRISSQQLKELFIKFMNEDSLFNKVIRFSFDPEKRFYIDRFKPRKRRNIKELSLFNKFKAIEEIFELLDKIKNKKQTKINRNLRLRLSKLINDLDESDFFNKIIRKDIQIGITTDAMFKMFKNLFLYFPYMKHSEMNYLHALRFPIYSFEIPYATSINAFVVIKNNKVKYYSHLGKEINIRSKVIDATFLEKSIDDVVFHVRLSIKKNKYFDKYKTLLTPIGEYYTPLYISKILFVISKNDKPNIDRHFVFHLLDIIPYDNFFNLRYNMPLKERIKSPLFNESDSKYLRIPKITYVEDRKDIFNLIYKENKDNMAFFLKSANKEWKSGRDKQNVLITDQQRAVLKIKSVFWGHSFGLKAIYCETTDRLIRVRIDRYFPEEFSKINWKEMIGKSIIIQYAGVTHINRHKTKTLCEAYFIGLTDDLPNTSRNVIKRSKYIIWEKKRLNRNDNSVRISPKRLRNQEEKYLKNPKNGLMTVNKA